MIIREVFVKLLLDSFGKLSIRPKYKLQLVSFMRILRLREVARATARIALEFAPEFVYVYCMDFVECYLILLGSCAFSVSLLLTPLCCDDIHDVTPRVSALAGCDRLESVDVVVGENWLLRHKVEMVCHEKVVKMPWNCKCEVGSNGKLVVEEASVCLVEERWSKEEYESHMKMIMESLKEEKMYVKFSNNMGSGAKRKLSRCGRNQMGSEPLFGEIVTDLGLLRRRYTTNILSILVADTMLCGFRLTNRWLSIKKDIASCGSKYLAYSKEEVEHQGSSRLLLQPELPRSRVGA
ncbi:hypothetical protein Tco_0233842 [Tanacetum coccineum]